ncbi:hypothetical protein P8452_33790 [Trifolium repens]|nr:hypothetical protein P8452_33790 [Trifolium repens]
MRQQRRTWINTVTTMKTSAIDADSPWKIHRVRNQTWSASQSFSSKPHRTKNQPASHLRKKQKTKQKKKKKRRARQNEREGNDKITHIGETDRKRDRENEKGNLTRERESLNHLYSFLPLLLSLPPVEQQLLSATKRKAQGKNEMSRE